ncbi:RILP-like protein [Clonorchis sinensis]|uniref:RILP-like protein n=1 Tax=Clonorchis sinensis TaxID=79923 RepID=A0A3R7JNS3_CLOSI|nr:RILP-like protein [Clonorchis sinensis]
MFTSTDVYDAASSIGRDCQLIVGEYGPDILQDLMPNVIAVLEELEACALYSEHEQEEVIRLQAVLEALRLDCQHQAESKERSDRNLEQLEQSWYCETQRLLEQVTELEAENNRLAQQLASEIHTTPDWLEETEEADSAKTSVSLVLKAAAAGRPYRTADLQLIGRLKECVATNYRAIRSLNKELLQTNAALDAARLKKNSLAVISFRCLAATPSKRSTRAGILPGCPNLGRGIREAEVGFEPRTFRSAEEEVCRLARQSGQLVVSRAPHRRQIGQLVGEKATLETKLRMKERELMELNQRLPTDDEILVREPDQAKKQPDDECRGHVQNPGKLMVSPTSALPPALHISPNQGVESAMCVKDISWPAPWDVGQNKLTSDTDGLVTLEELRHLLYERNELRCRLIELEQELEILELENAKDPEVEGPMPLEPLDKLRPGWNTKPNIKTIFRRLLHRLTDIPAGSA